MATYGVIVPNGVVQVAETDYSFFLEEGIIQTDYTVTVSSPTPTSYIAWDGTVMQTMATSGATSFINFGGTVLSLIALLTLGGGMGSVLNYLRLAQRNNRPSMNRGRLRGRR